MASNFDHKYSRKKTGHFFYEAFIYATVWQVFSITD